MDVQHLDQAEDIEVRLFSREEVMEMLEKGEIWQSLQQRLPFRDCRTRYPKR